MKGVRLLKVMWNKREYATFDNLKKCYMLCEKSLTAIDSIVKPISYEFNN